MLPRRAAVQTPPPASGCSRTVPARCKRKRGSFRAGRAGHSGEAGVPELPWDAERRSEPSPFAARGTWRVGGRVACGSPCGLWQPLPGGPAALRPPHREQGLGPGCLAVGCGRAKGGAPLLLSSLFLLAAVGMGRRDHIFVSQWRVLGWPPATSLPGRGAHRLVST